MQVTRSNNKILHSELTKWICAEHLRFSGAKRLSKQEKNDVALNAKIILRTATNNNSLRVLNLQGKPIAAVYQIPSRHPRVKNQQSIVFLFDQRISRSKTLPWLKNQLRELARRAPRYTQIGMSPAEDKHLREILNAEGFHARYEILIGKTKVALRNLVSKKKPPGTLDHLGLSIRPITSGPELRAAIKLQRMVALRSQSHTYFSHTPAQLRRDLAQYKDAIKNDTGLLLGVYRKDKILGLMVGSIHRGLLANEATGGFSFFLHPSIQGLGITKTGYRILLEFFVQRKVGKFHGGTSQPAIQYLGKIMKRQVQHVIYLKMK